jgi:hypothetical protein
MSEQTGGASVFRAIAHEVYEARAALRPITHIRVTRDALAGTVAALPITPERARTIRLRAFPGGTVEADFGETERLLEIVIHPEDWRTLLTERDAVGVYAVNVGTEP